VLGIRIRSDPDLFAGSGSEKFERIQLPRDLPGWAEARPSQRGLRAIEVAVGAMGAVLAAGAAGGAVEAVTTVSNFLSLHQHLATSMEHLILLAS
jgi:hypothetical protein